MTAPRIILTAAAALCIMCGAAAQGRSEMDFVKKSNARLVSGNAAFLATLPLSRVSIVEAQSEYGCGGLVLPEESDNFWTAGANTESYIKVSEKIAFYGRMCFSYFYGKNMGGPVLMDPSYNPINFVEFTPDNNGAKDRELYSLAGGMSYSLGSKWALGFKADYQAGNQAKRKDPRFSNSWMDLGLSFGGLFRPSDAFSIGLDARFRKTMEGLNAGIYGEGSISYNMLVDFGGYFGNRELLAADENFVSVNNTRYMSNLWYGGAIQVEAGCRSKFFCEAEFLMHSGYFGKKGTTSVVFTEHKGMKAALIANYKIYQSRNIHIVGLDASFEKTGNNLNKYNRVYKDGVGYQIKYLGSTEILDKMMLDATVSYTGYIAAGENGYGLECGANAGVEYMQQTATVYPFYRKQNYMRIAAEIYGRKNFFAGKNKFTLHAAAAFNMGNGTKKEDGEIVSSTSDAPKSGDVYLGRWFEYLTAPQMSGNLAFRYTRFFKKLDLYVEISDRYTSSLKGVEFLLGKYRNSGILTIGCSF